MARNFYNSLRRQNRLLPVPVSTMKLHVRKVRPRVGEEQIDYPIITFRSWATHLLENHAPFILGGFSLEQPIEYKEQLSRFWQRYREIDPTHPTFSAFDETDYCRVLPYALHGDEGRGAAKVPVLVVGYQPVISVRGAEFTNMAAQLALYDPSIKVPLILGNLG